MHLRMLSGELSERLADIVCNKRQLGPAAAERPQLLWNRDSDFGNHIFNQLLVFAPLHRFST